MKLKYLLFFVVGFALNHTIAQEEFAPQGAEWCYQYLNTENEVEAFVGLSFVKDTFTNPYNAKLLRSRLINVSSVDNLDHYNQDYLYYPSSDSVSFIYGAESPLFYLFDTRYALGDTVLTYLFNSGFLVTAVDSTTFEDENIHISDVELILNTDFKLKFYGHLGPSTGFLEGWWTNPLEENTFDLAAYRDDSIGTIRLKEEACFSFLDYVEPERLKPDTCQLVVFPNPVQNPLTLKLECNNTINRSFDLIITDAGGRLCTNQEITFLEFYELNISPLPSGQYFGVLENENERYDFSFSKFR